MGRRLDGFDVELQFDADGQVSKVSYVDGDGCGREADFSNPDTKLMDLVKYHLEHYRTSHKMTPERRCSFKMTGVDNGMAVNFRCTSEPHGPHQKHTLEQV